MKVIILAAGQGTRLRPMTDHCPKCMVQILGKSIIDRQLDVMRLSGIREEDITIITGYRGDVLKEHLKETRINLIENIQYETTNMVCSLLCAQNILQEEEDVIISYGDIIYTNQVFEKILNSPEEISVIVDDGWYHYWSERCENPLEDAETLLFDKEDNLTEIGQKTNDLAKVQSQYIGLMRFKNSGIRQLLQTSILARNKTEAGEQLWKTTRTFPKMYMTDLLTGMIEEGCILKAVHINRGWYEVDDCDDLRVVENKLKEKE